MDSNSPFAADCVGIGYDEGVPPESGRENIANGPAISRVSGYRSIKELKLR
jgi:hypothetical protein